MFFIMKRTPISEYFNVDGSTKLREWLQGIPKHTKSCKYKYFLLTLLRSSET